jgi:hypothetical protein
VPVLDGFGGMEGGALKERGALAPLLISGVSLCHHALIKGARMVHRLNEKSDFIASCKNRLIGEKFAFGLGLLETARAAIAVIRMRDATEGHECERDCQCGLSDAFHFIAP